jgi:hypothetical protein
MRPMRARVTNRPTMISVFCSLIRISNYSAGSRNT